jgi:hypothetical protein
MSQNNQQQGQQPLTPEQLAEAQAKANAEALARQQQGGQQTISLSSNEIMQQQAGGGQQQEQGQPQQGSGLVTDNQGNVNVSRGIIGYVSSPAQAGGVTEGTIADRYNAPSKFPNAEGKVNPLTEEDLQNRIKLERSKAGMDAERQQQLAIKLRTEQQEFKYTPPEEFKDDPELAATPDNLQEGEPNVNQAQGEQLVNLDNNNNSGQQQTQQQQNQQENIKG